MTQLLYGPGQREAARDDARLTRLRPIFLHGMWRSGSTFVWSRFREAPEVCAYYEPLHPGLARLTRRRIPRDTAELTAANRHPTLSRPYFAEYEPLLGLRGVAGFRRGFTFERFLLDPDERHRPLRDYLARLTDDAQGQRLVPVLGFNQTAFRIAWLRRQFDSYDIQVERDPRDIWLSYMEHRLRGNFTYFRMWMQVAERNADHPLIAPIAERLPLRRGVRKWTDKPKPYYRAVTEALAPEALYRLVFYMWVASALHALSHCDLVIDTGLAGTPGYAQSLNHRILGEAGVRADLAGLKAAPPAVDIDLRRAGRIEEEVLRMFPVSAFGELIDPALARARLDWLTPRKAELLSRLV